MSVSQFRVVTYNIHRGRGMDRRVLPERLARVLAPLRADVVALQEVVRLPGERPELDQARFLADALGMQLSFGGVRPLEHGTYGNAVLTRLPLLRERNYDLTWRGRERRGCQRCDVELGGAVLHVFNVHLGTSFFERRQQGRRLLTEDVLRARDMRGPRIVVGDFNEWTRGLASRLMGRHFQSVDVKALGRSPETRPRTSLRTYPGVLPLLHLDHFYFDNSLDLRRYAVVRSREALLASDHLPLVADFAATPLPLRGL